MVAWYALAGLGVALIGIGIYAVFKITTSGDHSLELPGGFKVSSSTPGGLVFGAGVILVVLGLINATKDVAVHNRVTSVALSTPSGDALAEYSVLCPMTVHLAGAISLSGDPGPVSYRVERQDTIDSPIRYDDVRTLDFGDEGTQDVPVDIGVSIPQGTEEFEVRLATVDPSVRRSDPVRVIVHCDPSLPSGPPDLPPTVSAP